MFIDVLRTEKVIERYKARRKDPKFDLARFELAKLPTLRRWNHWILVENEFPYDKVADRHCLLVPIDSFGEDEEMLDEEREELFKIKREFQKTQEFDAIFENVKHNRTIPQQYHLHAIRFKYRTPISDLG